jgi:hypothetical protein
LFASSFDNFVKQLETVKDRLPVVTAEFGDTWINGISSDPWKMAVFREISRLRADCVARGECSLEDYRVYNFSRFLVKIPEHTWGLPSVYDTMHWSNSAFNSVRQSKTFVNAVQAWVEQR